MKEESELNENQPNIGILEASIGVPPAVLRTMYVSMLKIRKCEERIADLILKGEIECPCHLYIGQEAVAVGVCANLKRDDYVFSTHRSHGHYIAKGGDMKALMAELYGRVTGCSKGKGGSMHLASSETGLMGSSAIVAGAIPIAVGAALAFSTQKIDGVSVVFFGDGAVNEGTWYEGLNFASLKRLPVIFVCENNLYSTHMPIASSLADTNICKKADMFNMPGIQIDGNNVVEVFTAAEGAIERARSGEGPSLIECLTYRWRGHVGPNNDLDKGLRSKEELDYWTGRCPIKMLEEFLLDRSIISKLERDQFHKNIGGEIEEAVTFAKESPYPDESSILDDIFKT